MKNLKVVSQSLFPSPAFSTPNLSFLPQKSSARYRQTIYNSPPLSFQRFIFFDGPCFLFQASHHTQTAKIFFSHK